MVIKEIKIITHEEAEQLVPKWPADVSFSRKFSQLHSARHGFKSGYVVARYSDGSLIFPIQWGGGRAYSVHKGHTTPLNMGTLPKDPEWRKIGAEVRQLTKSDLYIADLAMPEVMATDLKPLPSAVFIIDTSSHNIETLFARFNKTTRNLIRRSQEQGFRVEIISGEMPAGAYKLYVSHQKSMGTPPRPKQYFDEVAKVFGDGFIIIGAYDNDCLVGMNLAWCAEGGLWLSINSSLSEYSSKHVNYLLYYEMLKWACGHGIDRVDFGGSPTRDGNVHNTFKLGFGASMTPIFRLVQGSFNARVLDKILRKKRALQIRINKFKLKLTIIIPGR